MQGWKYCPEPDRLEAIWISHFHGDHFFGLPALLARFWQTKRKSPLLLIGQQGTAEIVTQTLGPAYLFFAQKIEYDLRKDLAVRVGKGGKSVFYSGDGMPTE